MTDDKRFTCEVTDTDLCHVETITDNFEMNTFDDVETVTELLNKFSEENKELKTFKDKVFEVIDNHILEETDLRKECIENGSHYTANICRNIIDTLKLIKKELSE